MRHGLISMLLVVACVTPIPVYDYAKEPDPRNKELVLGVGDVLSINVWGSENRELNTDATIRPDGTITMPLVGDLHAAGATPSALKGRIKDQLANFVKLQGGTEITVAVKAWKSYRFTIEGEVGHPGVYTSDQYVNVAEALAMAGGVSRFANRAGIKLLRRNPDGTTRQIPLDYDELASGKRLDMNIYVLSGDLLYVP